MKHRSLGVCLLVSVSLWPALAGAFAPPPGSLTPPETPLHPTTLPHAMTTPPAATKPAGKAATQPAAPTTGAPKASPADADPKWLEKLSKEDRAALDETIGYAPAPFAADLKWLGAPSAGWDAMRGKVVVIQSFTTANMAGRKWPARIAESLKEYKPTDLKVIALHTPEGAAAAEEFLKKQKPPESVDVAIDPTGASCDALGIYKQPVNIVVDRCGTVRFAGLNAGGLDKAVALLVKEPFDHNNKPVTKAAEAAPAGKSASEYPPYTGAVASAKDIRGKKAPAFAVQQFVTKGKPDLNDKVVVIDFWATWCGPCRAAIPHMNALADRFGDKVCCIGVSDETKSNFDEGMKKYKLKFSDFRYNLALDPGKSMNKALEIRGIPLCIVMSKDWIVRWEGHPAELTEETLGKIIAADSDGPDKPASGKRRGWTGG